MNAHFSIDFSAGFQEPSLGIRGYRPGGPALPGALRRAGRALEFALTAKGCSKTGGAGGDPTKNDGFNGIKLTLNGMKQVTTIDI